MKEKNKSIELVMLPIYWGEKLLTINENDNKTKINEREDKLQAYRLVSSYTVTAVEKAIQEITEEIKNNSSIKNLLTNRKLELEKALRTIKHDTETI